MVARLDTCHDTCLQLAARLFRYAQYGSLARAIGGGWQGELDTFRRRYAPRVGLTHLGRV